MTCQQCKHEFFWICSGDWGDHDLLDCYLHYYKRYVAHQEAQKFAKRRLRETEEKMTLLQDARCADVCSNTSSIKFPMKQYFKKVLERKKSNDFIN
jgi:ariadne-1